ncbi:MAG: TonB-dependent receptor [Roseateles depolymerans]|uniref:TonB-dependent receptor n=1 Tax=Roseateles depolymerans TaxID=76731 RepID=A0A2W5FGY5_9BURK|nr:MAG: TonB-dependent receptor [Roseateles depolymerans]
MPAGAAEADPARLERVEVSSRARLGEAESASEGEVGVERLALRPLLRPAELLEAMPGMTVTQHSGDGKANQYFLRGYNLDHGSDFATFVQGMPVNMASHAHGQGYMDLNFLIPELVESLRYRKGAFAAEDGDFATTGASRIGYTGEIARPYLQLTAGPHGYQRGLAAGSTRLGAGWTALGALEGSRYDGPWDQPEGLHRRNAVLRLSQGDERNGAHLDLLGYSAAWRASEHVPERAIDSGEIGRWGTLSPDDGGRTHRHSLSGGLAWNTGAGQWSADAWVIDYALNLFSAPSGLINGPQGDQHEQADHRRLWGGSLRQQLPAAALPAGQTLSWGLQWRHDRIGTLGLYDTVDRVRTHTVREDRVSQDSLGLFAEWGSRWTDWLRSTIGARWDRLQARITPTGGEFNADNGGRAQQSQFSPKLGLIARLGADTEAYLHWARAFRSNDARGATTTVNPADGSATDALPLLARTTTAELGLRTRPTPHWTSSLALWQANLASELVFVGDEGVTEARGASRRVGLEWSNDVQLGRDWLIDADLAWSRARFVDPVDTPLGRGTRVPNAVPLSGSLSAAWQPGGRWSAGLKLRYLGSYALEETGAQRSGAVLTINGRAGLRLNERWELGLDVLNLLNRRANDIEYWGAACTRAEGPACNGGQGLDGRLVHPMEPRSLRLSLRALL